MNALIKANPNRKVQRRMMPSEYATGAKTPHRVLLASIDATIQTSLDELFDAEHYCVETINRAGEVLLALLERDVDLLIFDLDIQGIMGPELLPVIRKLRPRLPIILVTEDYTLNIRKIAAEQGMTYQTFKPSNSAETRAIIHATEKIIEKRTMLRRVN